MSLATALQTLANYRSHNTRAAQDTLNKGVLVLHSNASAKLGDEEWTFLEQLTLAALDLGRVDVADDCLSKLTAKFPGSPRVEILAGIRLEATEPLTTALKYYDDLLEADSANGPAWKRRISVLKRLGKTDKAVEELCQFLDTFYTDVEGWLELAENYSSCNQYTQALRALSHVLIIAPQNPYYVLQFAETAFTANDVQLALKTFLIVIDMSETEPSSSGVSEGITVRAWWGAKLCCRRLLHGPSSASPSGTAAPKHVNLIDQLATEKLLSTYSARKDLPVGLLKNPAGKDAVFNWMVVS